MNKHGGYRGDKKTCWISALTLTAGDAGGTEKRLETALDDLGRYPEITGETARNKIAEDIGVAPENVILGNGAIELIYLLPEAFTRSRRSFQCPPLTSTAGRSV